MKFWQEEQGTGEVMAVVGRKRRIEGSGREEEEK